jgi:hypothetical protein
MLRSVFALPFLLVASISMARSPKPEELPVSSGSSIQRVAAARARAGSCRTFLPHGRKRRQDDARRRALFVLLLNSGGGRVPSRSAAWAANAGRLASTGD